MAILSLFLPTLASTRIAPRRLRSVVASNWAMKRQCKPFVAPQMRDLTKTVLLKIIERAMPKTVTEIPGITLKAAL